jgi:hypothetical protein
MQLSFHDKLGEIIITQDMLESTINNIVKRVITNAKIDNVNIKEVNGVFEIKIVLSYVSEINFANELTSYLNNLHRFFIYNLNLKKCHTLISLNKS